MLRAFLLMLVAAAAFIGWTSTTLPPMVASHFAADGSPNGFMPRADYAAVMLSTTLLVPLGIALTGVLFKRVPPQFINLPHRAYWLDPQRRAATVAWLTKASLRFAAALAMFLCLVHGLVWRANLLPVPRLAALPMVLALGLFAAATVAWVLVIVRRFSRLPPR
jgi:hypothetical protein